MGNCGYIIVLSSLSLGTLGNKIIKQRLMRQKKKKKKKLKKGVEGKSYWGESEGRVKLFSL